MSTENETQPDGKDMGPLHRNLLALCPPDGDGRVSVSILANRLGISSYGIYKWIANGEVPPRRVPELLALQVEAFGEVRVPAHELNAEVYPAGQHSFLL